MAADTAENRRRRNGRRHGDVDKKRDAQGCRKDFPLIHLNRDQLVPRSIGNIVENIDRFFVAEAQGEMIGCASYSIHPEIGDPAQAMVEIQSLAIKTAFRRQGWEHACGSCCRRGGEV